VLPRDLIGSGARCAVLVPRVAPGESLSGRAPRAAHLAGGASGTDPAH